MAGAAVIVPLSRYSTGCRHHKILLSRAVAITQGSHLSRMPLLFTELDRDSNGRVGTDDVMADSSAE